MDQFETELSEMLKGRVAGMPGSYDAPPELLTRVHRRRTIKLGAFAATVVLVASGTTAAVMHAAGRHGAHRVSAFAPEPTTTVPVSAVLPAGPTVPAVACPVLFALTDHPPLAPPSTAGRVPAGGDTARYPRLGSFSSTTDPRYVVLGPRGWSCQTQMSADGNNGVVVYDPASASGSVPGLDTAPIAVDNDWMWHGIGGAQSACTVSTEPAVVAQAAHLGVACAVPPGRRLTALDGHVSTFVDRDGARGVSWMLLPPSPDSGDGQLSILVCRPTAGLTAADCDTIVADYAARMRAAE